MIASKNSYKIVLLGDISVGKTSVLNRILEENPHSKSELQKTQPTNSLSFGSLEYGDHRTLHFWDTSGEEKYKSMIPYYLHDTDLILLLFSCAERRSFENLKDWIDFYQEKESVETDFFLICNKIDLDSVIDEELIQKFCEENECIKASFNISALKNEGVHDLLRSIKNKADTKFGSSGFRDVSLSRKSGGGCCG